MFNPAWVPFMKSTVAAVKAVQSGHVLLSGGGVPARATETRAAVSFILSKCVCTMMELLSSLYSRLNGRGYV